MKKIVTVIALALICSGAYAQFNKGRILLNGGLSFTSATHKYEVGSTSGTIGKESTFTLTPKVGYFIIDNLAAGAGISMSSQSSKADGSSNKASLTDFTFDPFVRYYIDPGLFFQGTIGFGGSTQKSVTGSTTTTTKYGLFTWDIGAGYAYFLGENVAIEPMVLYGMRTYKSKEDNGGKEKFSGLAVNLSFTVYLGKN